MVTKLSPENLATIQALGGQNPGGLSQEEMLNSDYARMSPAQRMAYLEQRMQAANPPPAPAPPQPGGIRPDSYVPTLPSGAQPAPAEGAFRRKAEGQFPLVSPLERANIVGGAVLNGIGDTIGGPASQEWWQGARQKAEKGQASMDSGEFARGAGETLGTLFQGNDSPGFLGRDGIQSWATGAQDFFSGLLGSEQAPVEASPQAPPQAPQSPEAPAAQGKDKFAQLLDSLTAARRADQGAGPGGDYSGVLGADPSLAYSQGQGRGPAQGPQQPAPTRSRLEAQIDALAKQSELPEPVFKDRLSHVLVGLALGYARGYGETGNIGQGLAVGGGMGAAGGLQYNEDMYKKRELVKQQNLERTKGALALEGQLYQGDQAAATAASRDQIMRDRNAASLHNSYLQARSRLIAASIAKSGSGGSRTLMQEALDTINAKAAFDKYSDPSLDIEFQTPTGQKMKIGQIKDPIIQQAMLAAVQASQVDIPRYQAAYAEAQKIIESQPPGMYNDKALGGNPAQTIQALTINILAQQYMAMAGRAQQPQQGAQ